MFSQKNSPKLHLCFSSSGKIPEVPIFESISFSLISEEERIEVFRTFEKLFRDEGLFIFHFNPETTEEKRKDEKTLILPTSKIHQYFSHAITIKRYFNEDPKELFIEIINDLERLKVELSDKSKDYLFRLRNQKSIFSMTDKPLAGSLTYVRPKTHHAVVFMKTIEYGATLPIEEFRGIG